MISFSMSGNFSNGSSSQEIEICEILGNSLPLKTAKISAFSIILLSSFVGNILIIITVYKREELRNTINYFVVNMAISDFAFPLTVIPVHLAETASSPWQWLIGGTVGVIICKIKGYLHNVTLGVSVQSFR